jgi:hypothetical protein
MYSQVRDVMDSVNNWDGWWELSKLFWIARTKMGYIPLTGVG